MSEHARLAPSLKGARILVVEDNADLRECVVTWLKTSGAAVSSAASGNAGFALFRTEKPDVIISDLSMPDGSGYDLVRCVRGLPPEEGGLVPAIAVSATEDARDALMAGFHVLVPKPFDCLSLVEVIADFVRPGRDGQATAPWTITVTDPGRLLLTFVGRVETNDVRAMMTALLVHLEQGPVRIVADVRQLTSFAPSAASVGERAAWMRRKNIRCLQMVGGSQAARLVAAAACMTLGIPCLLSGGMTGRKRTDA
jgi:CheY-like chemotaxis protein